MVEYGAILPAVTMVVLFFIAVRRISYGCADYSWMRMADLIGSEFVAFKVKIHHVRVISYTCKHAKLKV